MNTTVVNGAIANASGVNTITALRQSLLSTIYIMLIALPGYWLAILFVARMGRYWMVSDPAEELSCVKHECAAWPALPDAHGVPALSHVVRCAGRRLQRNERPRQHIRGWGW